MSQFGFLGVPHNNALYISQGNEGYIYYADILGVDSVRQTMSVFIRGLNHSFDAIPINQMLSLSGAGIRVLPEPGAVLAMLYKDSVNTSKTGYHHIGYFVPEDELEMATSDKSVTKEGKVILIRYLEPGEVQIISKGQAEVMLSNDGTVQINSGSGNFINLVEYTQSIDMFSNDLNIELDNVSINAGRVKRVAAEDAGTDSQPKILRDITNEDKEDETSTPHTEFRVDIGTQYDNDTGAPTLNKVNNLDTSPTTGTLAFATKVFDQVGEPEKLLQNLDTIVNFLIKLPSKMHMGIDDLGNFYIVNEQTESYFKFRTSFSTNEEDNTQLDFVTSGTAFSCNKDKFSIINRDNNDQLMFGKDVNGNTQFSARTGDNIISSSDKEGLSLKDPSGSEIGFTKDGDIILKHKNGRCLMLDANGLTINMAEAVVTILSKNVNVTGEVAFGGQPTETVIPAQAFASFYDTHAHMGPGGPVASVMTPQVMSGALQAAAIKISI